MDSGLSGTDVQKRVVGRYKKWWVQARIQDFLTGGRILNFSHMLDRTGKSPNSRTRSVRDIQAGGSGVARSSAPQRGPGRRILEPPYTQNCIKKCIF